MCIAGLHFFFHIMEGIKHQQGVLQFFGSSFCQFCVVQQFHQGVDVVTTEHGAQQLDRVLAIDQRRSRFAFGEG